ncbi:hypothetical protein K466DRAFT_565783 [Polyporus arcularius HHB13444]|uniref:Uncharacterized protein n=1 Tax=Polyporus arcularius HHB13444 TaxID=1314778 RepID=A0A5C3PCP9_9APHY|nr:hypothetical protein K466DRAFT_565783 [Polyporus arcularius HHB13444]
MDRQLTFSSNATIPGSSAESQPLYRITVNGAPGMPISYRTVQENVSDQCIRSFDQWKENIEDYLPELQYDRQSLRLDESLPQRKCAQDMPLPPRREPFKLGHLMYLFVKVQRQEYEENGIGTWSPKIEPLRKVKISQAPSYQERDT